MTSLSNSFFHRPLAHRGYHDVSSGIQENSRKAFHAAIEAGYGIELDVQLSRDGYAMVFHDYEMSRLTHERGAIRTRTRDELLGISLKGVDETIPALPEILALVEGRAPLLIEIKDQDGAMGPDVGPLEKSVAEALSDYDGPVAVMGFNPHSVAELAKACPEIPRGIVSCSYPAEHWPLLNERTRTKLRAIPDYDRVGACFISHRYDDLQNPRVAELKAKGAYINCWTIRSVEAEAEARKIADMITFEGYAAITPVD